MTPAIFLVILAIFFFDWGQKDDPFTAAWYVSKIMGFFGMTDYNYTVSDDRTYVIYKGVGAGYIDTTPEGYFLSIIGFDTSFMIHDHKTMDDIKKLFIMIREKLNPNFGRDFARDAANIPVSKKYLSK